MNERSPLEMPDSLMSDLQYVDFRRKRPDPTPDLVTFEGIYTNTERQRFVLTLLAREDDEFLTRYRAELVVAFLARPDDASPRGERTEEDKPLAQLIEEGAREDELVLGLDVRCDSLPDGAGHRKRDERVTVFGHIDPRIGNNHRHCYRGPDRVEASAKGRVTLGGLTGAPNETAVPPSRDRDANRACWVRGEQAQISTYSLNAAWYRVQC